MINSIVILIEGFVIINYVCYVWILLHTDEAALIVFERKALRWIWSPLQIGNAWSMAVVQYINIKKLRLFIPLEWMSMFRRDVFSMRVFEVAVV